MSAAATLRTQIEASLSKRIPSALTPTPRLHQKVAATGIAPIDELLRGGLPVGGVTEIVGPECSGRTSLALSFVARMTIASRMCAWVDVSDMLNPESAAAAGVDLSRLLWVRCGVIRTQQAHFHGFTFSKYLTPPAAKNGLHGGGFGPHTRSEAKGSATAVGGFLSPQVPHSLDKGAQPPGRGHDNEVLGRASASPVRNLGPASRPTPWSRLGDALRVMDLLLQGAGFGAIVLDMGSVAPEHALRVPLATWFRYRTGAERTQASILLLTQQPCAKSSAGLVLRLDPGGATQDEATVLSGMDHQLEVARQRFAPIPSNVVPLRKPPQREVNTRWKSRTLWTATR